VKTVLAMDVLSHMPMSNREPVEIPWSAQNGLGEVCVLNNWCFVVVVLASRGGTLMNFVLGGPNFRGETPRSDLCWLHLAIATSLLVILLNTLSEDWTFSRMKTQNLKMVVFMHCFLFGRSCFGESCS
jgi:hypothetical protein